MFKKNSCQVFFHRDDPINDDDCTPNFLGEYFFNKKIKPQKNVDGKKGDELT